MKIHRLHFLTHVAAACLLVFSIFLLARGITKAYPTVNFEFPHGGGLFGNVYALPGDTNVNVGIFNIAIGGASIITNGSSYVIQEGDALTPLAAESNLKYLYDNDVTGQDYHDGYPVFNSVDNLIDKSETVMVSGTLQDFPASPQANSLFAASAWIDQNSNGAYEEGEDLMGLAMNASSVSDGDTIRLFDVGELMVTHGHNDQQYEPAFVDKVDRLPVDPAIISDNDSDGILSAGDTVLAAGAGDIDTLGTDDGVCFDGSINDDNEFDYTNTTTFETIWWDAAGDCATFDSGLDIVLSGASLPIGNSTEFGSEKEVGFLDVSALNTGYHCGRSGFCYEIVYTGVDGMNWSNNHDFTTDTVFFDASSVAGDGLIDAANAWNEEAYDLKTLMDTSGQWGGDAYYTYIDSNSNSNYDIGEPTLTTSIEPGTTTPLANGQVLRLLGQYDYRWLNSSPTMSTANSFEADRELLFHSTDSILDTGPIDGTGIDELVHRPAQSADGHVADFSIDNRTLSYFDHDNSGSFEIGDDIIDGSGLYGAEDLLNFQVSEGHPSDSFDDSSIAAWYLYRATGAQCAGEGVDTLIASKTSAPFLDQTVAVTADPFVIGDNDTPNNRLCLYMDIAAGAALGTIIRPEFNIHTVEFTGGSNVGQITTDFDLFPTLTKTFDVTPVVSPGYINQTNSVNVAFSSPGEIRAPLTTIVGFPGSISVDGASLTCTVNGESQSGASMTGAEGPYNVVIWEMNTDALVIHEGDQVVCTVTHLPAVSDVGVYTGGIFALGTNMDNSFGVAVLDPETSYTFVQDPGTGGGRVIEPPPVITPPTYDITVVTPNGGEVLKAGTNFPISWTSDPEVEYVNLAYSIDNGATFKDIVRGVPNTGSISWHVPAIEATQALIRIQSTASDASVRNVDQSNEVFTIVDPNKPYLTWRSPGANSSLQAGSKQWILWDSSKVITDIELSLSIDGGATYPMSTGKVKNGNAYQVQLPSEDITNAYMKIVGYAKGYDPITVITGPISILNTIDTSAIKVIAPNAMQAFVPGQTTSITWETTGDVPFVEVQFAPDGKTWAPISQSIPNTGTFDWTIPDIETQYGFIRVGGNSAYGRFVTDRSDEPFWIVRTPAPSVTLTAPGSGSSFYRGSAIDVLWKTVGEVPSTNLYLVFADGAKKALALGFNNTNLYQTTIPAFVPDTFNILLEGLNAQGVVISMDSSGPFYAFENRPVGFEPCALLGNCPAGKPVEKPIKHPIRDNTDCTVQGTCTNGNEITFLPPGAQNDSQTGEQDVSIAIFDQSGLAIYDKQVIPRITVANGTIELDPRKDLNVIAGTDVLIELVTDKGNFTVSTNDGRSIPMEVSTSGVRLAYVPVGIDTTHIKIQSQDLNPAYVLSLKVNPQPHGYVSGLTKQDGSEQVTVLHDSIEWDSSTSGQQNPVRLGSDNLYAWYVPNGIYNIELRSGDTVITTKRVVVTNNIVNQALILNPEPVLKATPFIVDVLLPDDVQQVVLRAVDTVRANEGAQTAAAIAVPAAAIAVATGASVLGASFNLLAYLQYLFTSPLLLFGRRKRRSYGTVYNSATKAPVPFATIRFYDKDNRISRSVITDTAGRYTVALPPGEYRPVVIKPGFLFPSEQISSDVDGDLEQVYSAGFIHVTLESPFVMMHFPIDPDQIAGRIVSLRRVAIMRTLQYSVASVGVLVAIYATFMNPSKTTIALLGLQILVLFISFKLTKLHARVHIGKVIDAQGNPIAGTVVRLFEATYNKLVETQRTDAQGRYSFLAKDGSFYVIAETARGKVKSAIIDYRGETELKPVAPVLKV